MTIKDLFIIFKFVIAKLAPKNLLGHFLSVGQKIEQNDLVLFSCGWKRTLHSGHAISPTTLFVFYRPFEKYILNEKGVYMGPIANDIMPDDDEPNLDQTTKDRAPKNLKGRFLKAGEKVAVGDLVSRSLIAAAPRGVPYSVP